MVKNEPISISTKDFLRAFYSDNETVYLRRFNDRDKDEYGANMEVPFSRFESIERTLKRYNADNYGIFFVVNGGGQKDEDVKKAGKAKAQFMEVDDYSISEQLDIINAFPLEPSIVVRTRKSLHSYWLLQDGDIKRFRSIQEKMIQKFGSDPRIKNESRLMRLPNYDHCKLDPVRVEVIHFNPEIKYTQDQIEKVLPELEKQKSDANKVNATQSVIEKGNRVTTLVSYIGKFKNDGLSNDVIKASIDTINNTLCNPPIDQPQLEREVYPAITRFSASELPTYINKQALQELIRIKPEYKKYNDKSNGNVFAEVYKSILRWNTTAKQWFFYDGKRWREDEGGMVAAAKAKELFDTMYAYLPYIEDTDTREHYSKHIRNLGALSTRKRMLEDARDKYNICKEKLDRDPFLMNCQNGVLNLNTLEFIQHDPELLLSKICIAEYDPAAKCPIWLKFLNEVMQDDQELIEYIQKILGYSLTGDTKEEICFILYGSTTRNGKSTLVETISYMLGGTDGYAMNIQPETLASKRNKDSRQASGDIARLDGCRFLNAAEPPKRMIFDVNLLKQLTGRDKITARHLQQSEFEFVPCFKLFINTNFLPLVSDDTLFSSDRLVVIPFDRHFTPEEQDKELKDKLKSTKEISGILNWCIEGLKKYQTDGLTLPQASIAATNQYRNDSDKIGTFFEERMEKSTRNTAASDVFGEYKEWCEDNGYGCENKGNFFGELRAKGLLAKSATIGGKTVRNVVIGYSISREFEPDMYKNVPEEWQEDSN